MTEDKPTAVVRFKVPPAWENIAAETLWAYDLGKDRYKVANLPFYIYGVSAHDIVLAPYDKKSGFPTFKRVIFKSGNRTLRVVFNMRVNEGNESDHILNQLINMGCGREGADGFVFAVNVPPATDLNAVVLYLEKAGVTWELADPMAGADEVWCSDAN